MASQLEKEKKEWTNHKVAELFRSVAAAYQVKDEKENKFKIAAYDQAATSIEHLSTEIKDLWDVDKLNSIAGIGGSMIQHLDELFKTGKVNHFSEVLSGLPKAMFEILKIKGIGSKTAFKICQYLGIRKVKNAVSKLKRAAKEGRIRKIPGMGKESEKKILEAVERFQKSEGVPQRTLLYRVDELVEQIVSFMKEDKAVIKIDPLGSLRRKTATIGDIDIAVATDNPEQVVNRLASFPGIEKILKKGEKKASAILKSGQEIDLMVQNIDSYGALLQHFTGSKEHNIHLRETAIKKGLSVSEYGIRKLKVADGQGSRLKIKEFSTEKEFYNYLGMEWIPPELRENMGEIEAAQKHKLPKLLELKDIKGDLHIHSDFQIETSHDLGADSMEEFVKKAASLSYQYLSFSEHNPSRSRHNKNQIIALIKAKRNFIEQNKSTWVKKYNVFVINSLEIDIRPDGTLSIPNEALVYLDYATVSVHSVFRLSREKMTDRVLKALNHPKIRVLGHPTGRLLNEREGYELDWERVFSFCKSNEKFLEINAWPNRLDLPDFLIRKAVKRGVKMIISTDSHAIEQIKFMNYGVYNARRGWAEKKNIVNTLPFPKLCEALNIQY